MKTRGAITYRVTTKNNLKRRYLAMQEETVKICPACGRDMQAVSFSTFEGVTFQCTNPLCDYEETEPNVKA